MSPFVSPLIGIFEPPNRQWQPQRQLKRAAKKFGLVSVGLVFGSRKFSVAGSPHSNSAKQRQFYKWLLSKPTEVFSRTGYKLQLTEIQSNSAHLILVQEIDADASMITNVQNQSTW